MLDANGAEEAEFFLSSYTGSGSCVAVARLADGSFAVRHSRRDEPILIFNRAEWAAFVAGVKDGEFDVSS